MHTKTDALELTIFVAHPSQGLDPYNLKFRRHDCFGVADAVSRTLSNSIFNPKTFKLLAETCRKRLISDQSCTS
jgi:hypothetical protein